MKRLLLYIFFVLYSFIGLAQRTLILDSDLTEDLLIAPSYIGVMEDSLQAFSISDVSSPSFDNLYYTIEDHMPHVQNTKIA